MLRGSPHEPTQTLLGEAPRLHGRSCCPQMVQRSAIPATATLTAAVHTAPSETPWAHPQKSREKKVLKP